MICAGFLPRLYPKTSTLFISLTNLWMLNVYKRGQSQQPRRHLMIQSFASILKGWRPLSPKVDLAWRKYQKRSKRTIPCLDSYSGVLVMNTMFADYGRKGKSLRRKANNRFWLTTHKVRKQDDSPRDSHRSWTPKNGAECLGRFHFQERLLLLYRDRIPQLPPWWELTIVHGCSLLCQAHSHPHPHLL